jgi:regulator of sigma E protease
MTILSLSTILDIAAVIFLFGFLILTHEFGHFIVARRKGVRVINFSFGFGPEILYYVSQRSSTRYSIRVIPFGGFVKLAGEEEEEYQNLPDEFLSKPWYQKIQVFLAGPLLNYFLGWSIFSLLFIFVGVVSISEEPIIGEVLKGKPAELAGLQPNDRIIKIDNVPINSWFELSGYIHSHPGKSMSIEIERDSKFLTLQVKSELDTANKIGIIGIKPKIIYNKISPIAAVITASWQTVGIAFLSFRHLIISLITRTSPDIAGPIGIAQATIEVRRRGTVDFFYFIATVSAIIGILNLLPFVPFDGGYVVISLIEGISGKKIHRRLMQILMSVGLAIIVFIFLIATYNDIGRLLTRQKLLK